MTTLPPPRQMHTQAADARFLKFILWMLLAVTLAAGSICTGLAYEQASREQARLLAN